MTHVRQCRLAGETFRVVAFDASTNKDTQHAKRQRVRGEKTPRTLVRFVGISPRASGLNVTLAESGNTSTPPRLRAWSARLTEMHAQTRLTTAGA